MRFSRDIVVYPSSSSASVVSSLSTGSRRLRIGRRRRRGQSEKHCKEVVSFDDEFPEKRRSLIVRKTLQLRRKTASFFKRSQGEEMTVALSTASSYAADDVESVPVDLEYVQDRHIPAKEQGSAVETEAKSERKPIATQHDSGYDSPSSNAMLITSMVPMIFRLLGFGILKGFIPLYLLFQIWTISSKWIAACREDEQIIKGARDLKKAGQFLLEQIKMALAGNKSRLAIIGYYVFTEADGPTGAQCYFRSRMQCANESAIEDMTEQHTTLEQQERPQKKKLRNRVLSIFQF